MSKTARTPLEIRLVGVLRRIARDYQSAEQLLRNGEREYGISGSEALEYAYDNIQCEARAAVKGIRVAPSSATGSEPASTGTTHDNPLPAPPEGER